MTLLSYRDLLKENAHKILIIHYSCSDITQVPVRISCIGVRDEYHNQTLLLSSLRTLSEEKLLEDFWRIMVENSEKYFIGWNIKNPEFGFNVLKERYEELSGKKTPSIKEDHIIDLDEAIKRYYNLKSRKLSLKELAEMNGCQTLHCRDGKEEIRLFEDQDFKALELSVGRKLKIVGDILDNFVNGKLKLNSVEKTWSRRKIIGISLYVLVIIILDSNLFSTVGWNIIGIVGVEIAILLGFPKFVEWLKR